MTTGNSAMQLEQGAGWSRGLRNLLRGELSLWFGSRRWLTQLLLWAAIVDGILLAAGLQLPLEQKSEMIMIFNVFLGMAPAVGVAILMMGAVVDEKRSGTAAWILSKPVSRISFLLSKLLGNLAGVLVSVVAAQTLIGYLLLRFVGGLNLAPGRFALGMAAHVINLLFYLTLTLMLGAIFDHPGPVAAISIGFVFTQQYLPALLPFLAYVIPYPLFMTYDPSKAQSIAGGWMTGTTPASLLPVFTTLLASLVFVVVGLWVFQRQEL